MSSEAPRRRAGGTDGRDVDLVVALSYYAPYVSGVTEYARVVAEGLAARGRRVVVVAAHHDRSTPASEVRSGVAVVRTPVVARIGKGVISPMFVPTALRWARRARAVLLHAPMLEAGAIATGVPQDRLTTLYHCDVSLPPGPLNRVQTAVLDASHRQALRRSSVVAVTTEDYARSSRLAAAMAGRTLPVAVPAHDRGPGTPRFRDGDGPHVGFLGRIVEEKGLEYLVEGFRRLGPDARLLIAGDFAGVAGGSVVDRVRRAIGGDPRVRLLGFLPDADLGDFYASLDVFALPSVNAFEAFGIVQVEAMLRGVPVLTTDLPGVRVPVQESGFGRVIRPRDPGAIAEALADLVAHPPDPVAGAEYARRTCAVPTVVDRFDALLDGRPARG